MVPLPPRSSCADPRPRLLDLFCGAGGAAMGYHRAGFDVVGVDINKQKHYPFEFHQADALTYPLDGFDAIHASPPCQAYTRKSATWGRARKHFIVHKDLLGLTRDRLLASGVSYVIENVVGSPIETGPSMFTNTTGVLLCGTMFGLRIIKHRQFEVNWAAPVAPRLCDHRDVYNPWQGKGRSADKLRAAQGTQWIPISGGASRRAGYTGDLFNAIPPAYTEFIGRALLAVVKSRAAS